MLEWKISILTINQLEYLTIFSLSFVKRKLQQKSNELKACHVILRLKTTLRNFTRSREITLLGISERHALLILYPLTDAGKTLKAILFHYDIKNSTDKLITPVHFPRLIKSTWACVGRTLPTYSSELIKYKNQNSHTKHRTYEQSSRLES